MLSTKEQDKIINSLLKLLNKEDSVIFSTCKDSAIEAYQEARERLTAAGVIYYVKYFSDCITIKVGKNQISFLYLDSTMREQKNFFL
mgnify:CR=1 FL=1